MDGDVQLLFQRFEDEVPEQEEADMKGLNMTFEILIKHCFIEESGSQHDQSRHFLNLLSQWSCEELDEKLKKRVEFSQRTIAKLLQSLAQISAKNTEMCKLLKGFN